MGLSSSFGLLLKFGKFLSNGIHDCQSSLSFFTVLLDYSSSSLIPFYMTMAFDTHTHLDSLCDFSSPSSSLCCPFFLLLIISSVFTCWLVSLPDFSCCSLPHTVYRNCHDSWATFSGREGSSLHSLYCT